MQIGLKYKVVTCFKHHLSEGQGFESPQHRHRIRGIHTKLNWCIELDGAFYQSDACIRLSFITIIFGALAQLGEHLSCTQEVANSTFASSTIIWGHSLGQENVGFNPKSRVQFPLAPPFMKDNFSNYKFALGAVCCRFESYCSAAGRMQLNWQSNV